MNSKEIRQSFIRFFEEKQHLHVHSAPIVVKNDPTLMFTNAGMNQFKDIFLGNIQSDLKRVANTQKCLRVSGKHNDLEEVGFDTYHHTMFEMLGNWSFGDYFKEEAIAWAWEFLTKVLHINEEQLYVTYFEGSDADKLAADDEAKSMWLKYLPENRIIKGSKKDNFWEMGETGPCGPCSEIHADIRPLKERQASSGKDLVNTGNPLVIEIWNLVFIQFNRMSDGSLQPLPQRHVDTGMGFERLSMVVQNKASNYDTDVFTPLINKVCEISKVTYGSSEKQDIAIRVVSDHIRAVAFAIADGQLPSNTGAGYVIRRILRRAVRYGYTFLDLHEPFLCKILPVLSDQFGDVFPEIKLQLSHVTSVIEEEEASFLRTLGNGIVKFDNYVSKNTSVKMIPGDFAFELYDTYGFPIDLTQIMAREKGIDVNMDEFKKCLQEQKERSRADAKVSAGDWTTVLPSEETRFVGYDYSECEAKIVKFREVAQKGKTIYQVVLDITPFYAESGGQVGDSGYLLSDGKQYKVFNTGKENNLIVHFLTEMPQDKTASVKAVVDAGRRFSIASNHSATHLLHFALRKVLGTHVEQKGSLVHPDYLRFDFSHFKKLEDTEIVQVENIVNQFIVQNIALDEKRSVPMDEAKKMGAMALFGEKYGNDVRVVRFGDSVELCGGIHLASTSQIGLFKIITETSIASGVRRIEAITGQGVYKYLNEKEKLISGVSELLNHPPDIMKNLQAALNENTKLKEEISFYEHRAGQQLKDVIKANLTTVNASLFGVIESDFRNPALLKDIVWQLRSETASLFLIILVKTDDKIMTTVALTDDLVKKGLHAVNIVKELAAVVKGGGGGQPFYATAGGSDLSAYNLLMNKAKEQSSLLA
ncbi:MAG: alanine--tRNA ligase [Bacteroidetes bacterium HGW-Bacteroidetes-21]|nr:MAG: alanine--tRNA ligase [Bacteroidetes bacterium HGW-Bacteroidetes-21]